MADTNKYFIFLNNRNKIQNILKSLKLNLCNYNLDNLTKYLNNNKYKILSLLKILKYYNVNMNIKDFNILIIIYYFPNNILTKDSINKTKVLNSTVSFMNYISIFDPYDYFCIFKIINRIKRFLFEYNIWKEIDKRELVKELASEYYKLESLKDDILNNKKEDDLFLNELEKLNEYKKNQNIIYENIKKIDGIQIFNSLQPIEIEYDDNYINNLKLKIEDEYWKLIKYELKLFPIKTKYLILVIDEIKYIYYIISKHQTAKLLKLEKFVNTKYFKKDFDSHYFLCSINYLFEQLKILESIKYKDLTDSYIKKLKYNMIEGNEFYEFIPELLRYLVDGFYGVLLDKNNSIKKYDKWKKMKL